MPGNIDRSVVSVDSISLLIYKATLAANLDFEKEQCMFLQFQSHEE